MFLRFVAMQVHENISLKSYNTFGIDVNAKHLCFFHTVEEIQEILSNDKLQTANHKLILGGGSNILFTKDFDGLVLKNELKGIELVKEDDD